MSLDRSDRKALRSGKEELTGEALEPNKSTSTPSRRRFLAVAGSAATAGLAGCFGDGGSGDSGTTSIDGTEQGSSTTTSGTEESNDSGPVESITGDIADTYRRLGQFMIPSEEYGGADYIIWRTFDLPSIHEKTEGITEGVLEAITGDNLINPLNTKATMGNTWGGVEIGIGYNQQRVSRALDENDFEDTGNGKRGFTIYEAGEEEDAYAFREDVYMVGDPRAINAVLENYEEHPGWNDYSRAVMESDTLGGDSFSTGPWASKIEDPKYPWAANREEVKTETLEENGRSMTQNYVEKLYFGVTEDHEIVEDQKNTLTMGGFTPDELPEQ